jgi:hypothetical protein
MVMGDDEDVTVLRLILWAAVAWLVVVVCWVWSLT